MKTIVTKIDLINSLTTLLLSGPNKSKTTNPNFQDVFDQLEQVLLAIVFSVKTNQIGNWLQSS